MSGFAKRLLDWFAEYGRHDLPWQSTRDPYRIWVSEVMLQQTQVATAIPYFERFITRFPDLQALADADTDDVMAHWAGLGYYSRARNLHAAARILRDEHGCVFPDTIEQIMALPGVGRSTGAAVLALAYSVRAPILDGNCKRVYARHRGFEGWAGDSKVAESLWQIAEELTPTARVAEYTQAIMDLGATVCSRSKPRCDVCPVHEDCVARLHATIHAIPGKRPKRVRPVRSTQMLVIESGKREVLLELRPPKGIWGGLWSLPESAGEADVGHMVRERFGFEVVETTNLAPVRHQFTHFTLDMTPVHIRTREGSGKDSYSDARWVRLDALDEIGLPAPVTRILAMLESPS